MGLDLVELTFRIEREFHIEMSMDDLSRLVKDNDVAVGDLYEFILHKSHLRDVGRHSLRVNQYLWRQMRHTLQLATELPLEQIELGSTLDVLFPRENRRMLWNAMRQNSPYHIRELDYPMLVRRACLLAAVVVVAIEQLQIWQIPAHPTHSK